MNPEMNEMNQFDRSTDFSGFTIDFSNSIHSTTEKDNAAVGNPPEHLDLEAWESKTGDRFTAREAGATNTSATQQWAKQFGTSSDDYSNGIVRDSSGNVYLTGYTYGDLAGKNAGSFGFDAWVAKYDSNGNQQWTKQFGYSGYSGYSDNDFSNGISIDNSGNVYLTGYSYTYGNLAGQNTGSFGYDAWVAKYDSSGNQQWTKQFGTSSWDYSKGIATDSSGNVYLTGYTYGNLAGKNAGWGDVWIAKYDSSGNQQWTKQFGSSADDFSNGISIDNSGNVYLTGNTKGDLAETNAGYSDAWVAKYDANGSQLWTKQFGTSDENYSNGIATDSSGNIYLTGNTKGDLVGKNAGSFGYDAWVAKYDSTGNQQWTKQFGTSSWDYSNEIATDSSGNVYLTGHTEGDLAGQNAGWGDVWIAKYDSTGNQQWTKQFGTSSWDYSVIATDNNDNVYLTGSTGGGSTGGDLAGQNAGGYDAWVAKINPETQSKVSISATDSVAAETASGQTSNPGKFTITRTGDIIDPLTVNYAVNGRATNGEDYQKLTGSVIIPVGKTKVSLPIDAIDDIRSEYPEKVTVDLKSNIFYNLDAAKSATVTIADNEKPVVSIFAIDAQASETKTGETPNPGRLKVRRAGDLSNPLTVNYKVSGTATKGSDYKLPSKITFPAGVSTIGVPINIIDDALGEGVENANVILTSNSNYNLAKARSAKVAIADND
jgi:hypothetical protein